MTSPGEKGPQRSQKRVLTIKVERREPLSVRPTFYPFKLKADTQWIMILITSISLVHLIFSLLGG